MIASTSTPATVQMRRSHFLGLVAAVALVAVGITLLLAFAIDTGDGSVQTSVQPKAPVLASASPSERLFIEGISAMSNAQQAAAASRGPEAMLDALGIDPQAKRFIEGITSMALAQQAAAAASSSEAALDALNADPAFTQFIKGITSMAQAQQAAASGQ